MHLSGGCHCGNLTIDFETSDPAALAVRACQCTFCRAHESRNVTDPAGRIRVEVREPSLLSRYRFGLGTCEFFICARCGVYVAAVLNAGGECRATINVNALRDRSAFDRPATPVVYDAEEAGGRIARRLALWTPAEIVVLC